MSLYQPSPEELKASLPLPYVCAHLGILLDVNDYAPCPFHQPDNDPSFHLFTGDDGFERWSCFPCGIKAGDLFDLIQKKLHYTFSEACDWAAEKLADLPADYAPPRAARPTGTLDTRQVEAARTLAATKEYNGILAMASGLCDRDEMTEAARWDTYLRTTWGWGFSEQGVFMPHWDESGQLTGCKIRKSGGNRASLDHSRYDSLYGCWLGIRYPDTLLTEGETDAAWAGFQAAEEKLDLNILALPRGAQSDIPNEWIAYLAGARGMLYLALDPDSAGVDATWEWISALHTAGFGDRVRICRLPLKRDLRDAAPNLRHLLSHARRPLMPPPSIREDPGGYAYLGRGRDAEWVLETNWTFEPVAVLSGGEDPGYEGVLHSRGVDYPDTVIRLSDLESMRSLNRWTNRNELLFTGSDAVRVSIAECIEHCASIVPEIFQTDRVGLHNPPRTYQDSGPTIVYPGGHHGKTPWRYAPTRSGPADVSTQILLPAPGEFRWRWLSAFLALNTPDVTHPFISWLMAAGRRTEVERFPLMFIGGSSGVGKSTLAEYGLHLMGSNMRLDLGAVTPYILLKRLSASTTLPVFVDEYTRLSRRDTRETLQGAIPPLYTGDLAERGQADLSAQSYRMSAPVIVAGEDMFALDREVERIVAIHPSRAGQNHAANQFLAGEPIQRFGHMYHLWLAEGGEELPPLTSEVAVTRTEYNRGILRAGWDTLHALLNYSAGHGERPPDLPGEPDYSSLDRDSYSEDENVYVAALKEAYSMRDSTGTMIVWPDPEGRGCWFRARTLIGELRRSQRDIDLPGGERAMIAYFEERYGIRRKQRVTPPLAMQTVWATLIEGLDIEAEEEDDGTPQE